jgi:hypothetical protein
VRATEEGLEGARTKEEDQARDLEEDLEPEEGQMEYAGTQRLREKH